MTDVYDKFRNEALSFLEEKLDSTDESTVQGLIGVIDEYYKIFQSPPVNISQLSEDLERAKILSTGFEEVVAKMNDSDEIVKERADTLVQTMLAVIAEMEDQILDLQPGQRFIKLGVLLELAKRRIESIETSEVPDEVNRFNLAFLKVLTQWRDAFEMIQGQSPEDLKSFYKTKKPLIQAALKLVDLTKIIFSMVELPRDEGQVELIRQQYEGLTSKLVRGDHNILSDIEAAFPVLREVADTLPKMFSGMEKVSDKVDGKNMASVNGVYQDMKTGASYFIKKPDDPREFFTELLAGLIVNGLVEKKFIPEPYKDSLIGAQEILLKDRSYGLSQPYLEFMPLVSLLGNLSNKKRNVFGEVFDKFIKGRGYEDAVSGDYKLQGLSYVLMLKLFIGDYSVHDGNIGVIDSVKELKSGNIKIRQFVGFDLGAAFRAISDTVISRNIFDSLEERHRALNFYKDYISFYANMLGIFDEMEGHAQALNNYISNHGDEFRDVILEAVQRTFFCFKRNFDQDPEMWQQYKSELISYLYKVGGEVDDNKIGALNALSDEALSDQLAFDMAGFLSLRAMQLSNSAHLAPEQLRETRLQPYSSFAPKEKQMKHYDSSVENKSRFYQSTGQSERFLSTPKAVDWDDLQFDPEETIRRIKKLTRYEVETAPVTAPSESKVEANILEVKAKKMMGH